MIKVLVVEEYIIRKGMINTIDWLSMDCKIIGEGINGRRIKAHRRICSWSCNNRYRMPVMDDLKCWNCRRSRIEIWKIILTSYGEFKYAQEGIKLGVDYILNQ